MNRPAPRMSALSSSVVAPHAGKTHVASNTSLAGNNGTTGTSGKTDIAGNADTVTKLTVRVPAEVADEVRAAFWATSAHTQTRSLSAWVTDALEAKLERDRTAFNGGAQFSPIQAGEIPTGRRS
ncbi:hypothetical protein [Schaalia hyovaginalis]|uniref:hypothetical protein n=1 Tax=Schaalia hyovaginalis TaxID=29316 RepID=UPI0026ECC209|nr:hypothetical protein [Schaalia hyovaginalis]MCI7513481.1 hypothetical protein [Schaalia hyovaginalis]MDY3666353.1 hypothetical protein [Schaalia hyovaginalis]MDY4491557.1 hypothetical protein [Schaalia hyovaginalis]MDY5601801.1 hypothetical protein [Schaalia hyovaginalis]